jgi:hypothetical protein
MDKELAEIRARMEELAPQMQQDARSRWVYEWPIRTKVKWPVKELVAKRQQRLLRGWMRRVEDLNEPEEEMVQACEPEAGRNISDVEKEERLLDDLINYQEGRTKIPNCQEGNEMRSLWDLIDRQEDSEEISHCQEGNKMRSLRDPIDFQEGRIGNSYCQVGNKMRFEDLIDYQGSSREILYFQEGKGEQMSSELSSYKQGQLTKKEDHRNILMIGGIEIFLPHSPGEAKTCDADETVAEIHPAVNVMKKKFKKTLMSIPSEEWKSIPRNVSTVSARKLKQRR